MLKTRSRTVQEAERSSASGQKLWARSLQGGWLCTKGPASCTLHHPQEGYLRQSEPPCPLGLPSHLTQFQKTPFSFPLQGKDPLPHRGLLYPSVPWCRTSQGNICSAAVPPHLPACHSGRVCPLPQWAPPFLMLLLWRPLSSRLCESKQMSLVSSTPQGNPPKGAGANLQVALECAICHP